MNDSYLPPHLVSYSSHRSPDAPALTYGRDTMSYAALQMAIEGFSRGILGLGAQRGERIAIYLEKRFETVIASFGTTAAGCVFVPLNPLLKPEQVAYILRDCNVRVLVTSPERLSLLAPTLAECPDLRHIVSTNPVTPSTATVPVHDWQVLLQAPSQPVHRVIDTDMAAILYTSGSTGKPKGVVLSHRNMVAGAKSVASYLENNAEDTLLAALPLSFDAGFSQLTTAFHVGARVVLLNYLMPRDVLKAIEREHVTGLTAVPPLYIQLVQLDWPENITDHLRYFANTGGRMPKETLDALRKHLPKTKPYLMYGLTEAFRSTYLPPSEVDRRPDSIGKGIPNAEILVLREDGSPCVANEPGELVHRGALVGMGYWNDPEKTAERYKPLPVAAPGREPGLVIPEIAVFSGDTVRQDEEGFLYFIGRRDEMMKTSGYRVSPTEVEEILYATKMVGECVAFGVDHDTLGQAIQVIATPAGSASLDVPALLTECKKRMPAYMVPQGVEVRTPPLPRNPNGKIDRKTLSTEWVEKTQRLTVHPLIDESVMPANERPTPTHTPMTQFPTCKGELLVGGISLRQLTHRVGQTPYYAYDRQVINRRIEYLRSTLPREIKIHYAMKANPMPALVCHMAALVDGIDVASGGEMKVALDCGASPSSISFAGPGKAANDLTRAAAAGILINIESFREVVELGKIRNETGYRPRVAVRVNPDFELKNSGMKMGGGPKQFGVDAEKVPELLREIAKADLDFEGFHLFAGAQNLKAEAIVEAQRKSYELARSLAAHAPVPLRSLNLGGGFGIPYFPGEEPLDLTPIAANLADLSKEANQDFPQAELVIELGRYLVGEAGIYVARVIDRKDSRGQTFLVTDGGLHHHLSASGNFGQVIRKNYPVAIGTNMAGDSLEKVCIVGPLCTPLDILADRMTLPAAEAGDLVVIYQSGAYGFTASPQAFLGHPACVEVLV